MKKSINSTNSSSVNISNKTIRNQNRGYYIQPIPTQLISNYEFENKLRKFCLDNPSKKKNGSHGYHRSMNILHREKDHPRYDYNMASKDSIGKMFAEDFLVELYGEAIGNT